MTPKDFRDYIDSVLLEDRLDDELLHLQHLLIGATKYPNVDKCKQAETVAHLNALFRALLHAKETAQHSPFYARNQLGQISGTRHTEHSVRKDAINLKYR
jgi:hypothetical protein